MGGFGMAVNPELLYPPIELAHVASVLLADGHEVAIYDADARGDDAAAALEFIANEAPTLICMDSSSTSLDCDLELARKLRERLNVPLAILGSQVTYTPGELFDGNNVDVVVRGEPEFTVQELAKRVAAGEGFEGVEGTSRRDKASNEIVHEPARDKIKDLDDLPIPARHLLDNSLYKFPGLTEPVTTVKSSRGCPLNCSFCGYTLAQGLKFRFRSPEHVVSELVDLHRNHGLRQVVFRDPIFTTRKDRVRDICDGIMREGLDLEWQCETAIKTLDRETLEKMAAAGCRHISLGVESGNDEIQKKHCGNKLSDHAQAQAVFDDCRELGIETRAFCMIGFPEETESMVEETYDLVERLDPDQVQFCAVTAYPGTPLHQILYGDTVIDYSAMTGFNALEGNEHMTAERIEGKIREGYRRFYLRPRRIVREMRHPMRMAGKMARYFTLFARRA
ncbi:MAG: anaerobic magnesium-protoporphyrin IX monomethyl ester cyclase [Planctomycetota bacterium]|jgi:anaerobic magnesium-protoporphyrin IX monomethyl ester cyclase